MPKLDIRTHTTVYELKGRVRVYWSHVTKALHIHEGDIVDVDYSKFVDYEIVFDSNPDKGDNRSA